MTGTARAEIELIFGNPYIIATGLAAPGLMIILSSKQSATATQPTVVGFRGAAWIGAIQGCLPFRGFSRSGSTISTGLLLGLDKQRVEEFSFALAVVLTPAVIAREGYRLLKVHAGSAAAGDSIFDLILPSLIGMALSFAAGLIALRWLSRWLEQGRWQFFGYYCLIATAAVLIANAVLW